MLTQPSTRCPQDYQPSGLPSSPRISTKQLETCSSPKQAPQLPSLEPCWCPSLFQIPSITAFYIISSFKGPLKCHVFQKAFPGPRTGYELFSPKPWVYPHWISKCPYPLCLLLLKHCAFLHICKSVVSGKYLPKWTGFEEHLPSSGSIGGSHSTTQLIELIQMAQFKAIPEGWDGDLRKPRCHLLIGVPFSRCVAPNPLTAKTAYNSYFHLLQHSGLYA